MTFHGGGCGQGRGRQFLGTGCGGLHKTRIGSGPSGFLGAGRGQVHGGRGGYPHGTRAGRYVRGGCCGFHDIIRITIFGQILLTGR